MAIGFIDGRISDYPEIITILRQVADNLYHIKVAKSTLPQERYSNSHIHTMAAVLHVLIIVGV